MGKAGVDYTVVVIAYRSREPLTRFLDSLGPSVPVIIVDNSSAEEDIADLAVSSNVTIVDAQGNIGFSAGANLGARQVDTRYTVFMNPDTLPTKAVLDTMSGVLDNDSAVAACGPTGIDTAGGGAQPTIPRVLSHVVGLHRVLPMSGIYLRPRRDRRVDAGWISGSCCMVRTEDFADVGGYDETYFVFMSDFDLGVRLQGAGRGQLLLGDVVMRHFDGGSSDLPSEWTWDQRGRGWTQFLIRHAPGTRGRIIEGLLIGGFSLRGVAYRLFGRPVKAAEQATMVRAMRDERRRAA
jgi:GT2 family glycosyltransferase